MKRYLVFAHDMYYPSGGIGDVRLFTDEREEVVEWYKQNESRWDCIDVMDTTLEPGDWDIWQEIHAEARA